MSGLRTDMIDRPVAEENIEIRIQGVRRGGSFSCSKDMSGRYPDSVRWVPGRSGLRAGHGE
jgi:hypothetical protein